MSYFCIVSLEERDENRFHPWRHGKSIRRADIHRVSAGYPPSGKRVLGPEYSIAYILSQNVTSQIFLNPPKKENFRRKIRNPDIRNFPDIRRISGGGNSNFPAQGQKHERLPAEYPPAGHKLSQFSSEFDLRYSAILKKKVYLDIGVEPGWGGGTRYTGANTHKSKIPLKIRKYAFLQLHNF